MIESWSAQVAENHRGSHRPAVIGRWGSWTGAELLERASGAAAWLCTLGLEPGRPVPALLGNTAPALALIIGGAATGHPIAPLGVRMTPAELTNTVAALRMSVLVTDGDHLGLASEVAARVGARTLVYRQPDRDTRPLPVPSPGATAYVLHTSGTTGSPKAVPIRQQPLLARTRLCASVLSLGPDSVYLSASPFHHIAGLGNLTVALGCGAGVLPVERFTVAEWPQLTDLGPTHAILVPTMVEMLLDAGALRPGSLRMVSYGAAPIRPQTVRRLMDTLPDVDLVQLFGQTEGSPITTLGTADHLRAAAGQADLLASVGRAAPGLELRIADPDDAGVGEVCARAPHLFRTGPDGWLRTGDLGRIDDHGYLDLSGRLGDMIVRGGENIYPVEVEDVLAQHPGVREVSVTGIPDHRLGETVAAFVVPEADGIDEDELRRFTRDRLAGFKVPAIWQTVAELPRNASGKVLRRALRDQFVASVM